MNAELRWLDEAGRNVIQLDEPILWFLPQDRSRRCRCLEPPGRDSRGSCLNDPGCGDL